MVNDNGNWKDDSKNDSGNRDEELYVEVTNE